MSNNFLNLLGLANRARKLVTGELLIDKIKRQEVFLVLIAEDASENIKKKLMDKCIFYHVSYLVIGTRTSLSKAIGKTNRVALGITDEGFANKISEKIGG